MRKPRTNGMRGVRRRRVARRDGSFAHLTPSAARMARRLFVALAGAGERRLDAKDRLWLELMAGVASCLEGLPGIVGREGAIVECGVSGGLIAHPVLYRSPTFGAAARVLDDMLDRLHAGPARSTGPGAAYRAHPTFRPGGLAA